MIQETYIRQLIEEKHNALLQKAVFIVDIQVSADNHIRVFIDSYEGISIDDCVAISRMIEQSLDRDKEDFKLDVSSAGLDMPLRVIEQYKKNIGRYIEVIDKGGKKVSGQLTKLNQAEGFTIEVERMIKPEGKKRKVKVVESQDYDFKDVKQVKIQVFF